MALKICRLMGLRDDVTDKIHIAAHLHDIGKIGIPDAILNKEEKLSEWEWEVIKTHPKIGADILSRSAHLAEMKDIILYHHERFDGLGYPTGLKEEKIPLGARIIAICDSIDAMTSNRVYRRAYSLKYCYMEIEKNLGTMYDPGIGGFVLEHWQDISKRDRRERGRSCLPRFGREVNDSWSLHHPKRKPSGINLTAIAERYCARKPVII